MKKLSFPSMMCLLALVVLASSTKARDEGGNDCGASGNYVNLGLPSGTLWKNKNEEGGFYTYEQAVNRFGDNLPTVEQFQELKERCRWSWNGSGYKVTGPNGNSIVLPASGYRECSGYVGHEGDRGHYWSSSPNVSDGAWDLDFNSDEVYIDYYKRCSGRSVRLVRNR